MTTTTLMLSLALLNISQPGMSSSPGAGVLVNRTQKSVALRVVDDRGIQTTLNLAPDRSLRLTRGKTYRVWIDQRPEQIEIDARRRSMEHSGEPTISSVRSPSWELVDGEFGGASETAWSWRYYQIREVNGRPSIIRGFTDADVERALAAYRQKLVAINFSLEPRLAHQPYRSSRYGRQAWEEPLEPDEIELDEIGESTDASIEETLNQAARVMQHTMLASAIRDFLPDTPATRPAERALDLEEYRGQLEFFVGPEETPQLTRYWDVADSELKAANMKAIVAIPFDISPELHDFVGKVAAGWLGVAPEQIWLTVPRHTKYEAVWRPPIPLQGEIPATRQRRSLYVWGLFSQVARADDALRLLAFETPVTTSEMRAVYFPTPERVVAMKTKSPWRYRGREDEVVGMSANKSLSGLDLRWRMEVEFYLWRADSNEPNVETVIRIVKQTKWRSESALRYVTVEPNWPALWVQPIHSTVGRFDVIARAGELGGKLVQLFEGSSE